MVIDILKIGTPYKELIGIYLEDLDALNLEGRKATYCMDWLNKKLYVFEMSKVMNQLYNKANEGIATRTNQCYLSQFFTDDFMKANNVTTLS